MLVIFGGLPGVGKTTIAKKLSEILEATYVRIDTIEAAIGACIADEGYKVGYAIAKDNLCLGRAVIADSVNPITQTRNAWREVANGCNAKFFEIEVVCSNRVEHERRVQNRTADIEGHKLPTWEEVQAREYEPWDVRGIRVDTIADIDAVLKHISLAMKDI